MRRSTPFNLVLCRSSSQTTRPTDRGLDTWHLFTMAVDGADRVCPVLPVRRKRCVTLRDAFRRWGRMSCRAGDWEEWGGGVLGCVRVRGRGSGPSFVRPGVCQAWRGLALAFVRSGVGWGAVDELTITEASWCEGAAASTMRGVFDVSFPPVVYPWPQNRRKPNISCPSRSWSLLAMLGAAVPVLFTCTCIPSTPCSMAGTRFPSLLHV